MKIRIKADGHNIRLWLPTSLLKGRIGYSIVKQALKNNYEKQRKSNASLDREVEHKEFEMPISRAQVREMYAALRRVIKQNGHFNVVEVESADGEKVLIRV